MVICKLVHMQPSGASMQIRCDLSPCSCVAVCLVKAVSVSCTCAFNTAVQHKADYTSQHATH